MEDAPRNETHRLHGVAKMLLSELYGLLELLPTCECDNTHENVKTVCRMCSARQTIANLDD